MTNSSIIKKLIEKYLKIENPSKGQPLVLDNRFYKKDKGFNSETLDLFDREGIQFILIGDNPGDKEKHNQEYFTRNGTAGTAGNYARTFLDTVSVNHSLGGNQLNYLILNKTPFSTNSTKNLQINTSVKSSCTFLLSALNEFVVINPDIIILIVGLYKGNKLNSEFYSQLHTQASPELIRHVRIGKHFSNGNFFDQWLRHELMGIKSLKKTSLLSSLTRIHEESSSILKKDLKIDFMLNKRIDELNNLLVQAASELKNNQIVLPETINYLLDISSSYSDIVLILEDELKRDRQEFLNFKDKELKKYKTLELQDKELQAQIKEQVKNEKFEIAARVRDKRNMIESELFREILNLNSLNEGFNLYKGCLLIVKPNDSFKLTIIEKFISEKENNEMPTRSIFNT